MFEGLDWYSYCCWHVVSKLSFLYSNRTAAQLNFLCPKTLSSPFPCWQLSKGSGEQGRHVALEGFTARHLHFFQLPWQDCQWRWGAGGGLGWSKLSAGGSGRQLTHRDRKGCVVMNKSLLPSSHSPIAWFLLVWVACLPPRSQPTRSVPRFLMATDRWSERQRAKDTVILIRERESQFR